MKPQVCKFWLPWAKLVCFVPNKTPLMKEKLQSRENSMYVKAEIQTRELPK